MALEFQVLKRPTFLLKLVELILAALCIALVTDLPVALTLHKIQVVYATIFGFTMINIVVIPGQVMGTPLHQLVMLAVAGCAGVMFVTAGALMCECYDKIPGVSGRLLGAGVLALVDGCLYFVDCVFSFKELGSTS